MGDSKELYKVKSDEGAIIRKVDKAFQVRTAPAQDLPDWPIYPYFEFFQSPIQSTTHGIYIFYHCKKHNWSSHLIQCG